MKAKLFVGIQNSGVFQYFLWYWKFQKGSQFVLIHSILDVGISWQDLNKIVCIWFIMGWDSLKWGSNGSRSLKESRMLKYWRIATIGFDSFTFCHWLCTCSKCDLSQRICILYKLFLNEISSKNMKFPNQSLNMV